MRLAVDAENGRRRTHHNRECDEAIAVTGSRPENAHTVETIHGTIENVACNILRMEVKPNIPGDDRVRERERQIEKERETERETKRSQPESLENSDAQALARTRTHAEARAHRKCDLQHIQRLCGHHISHKDVCISDM